MTSSLVGSEMCIRDSMIKRHIAKWSCISHNTWRTGLPSVLKNYVHMNVSVSYTHLTLPTICSV
eukprot:6018307-Prorocentrum_lima.AAC.1